MLVTNDNFTELFEKYRNDIYAVAYNYLLNAEDANDMLQDTFIKLLKGNVEYESDEHIKAWLIRVCINLCKNNLRSRKHYSNEELTQDIPYVDSHEEMDLLKAIFALPEKYRVPIHLFYYETYQIKDIAQVMGIPAATVKVRLKRGRDLLRKTLSKEDWIC